MSSTLYLHLLFLFVMPKEIVFDFNSSSDLDRWQIVNDGVMGGRSQSNFKVNDAGHGEFSGQVSLANNGGFASVRYRLPKLKTGEYSKITIRLKGDGKRYQFRVKRNQSDYESYITYFKTIGEWQEIVINLHGLSPTFHGRTLDMDNFQGDQMAEIGFLIGNKEPQEFTLEIDKILLS